ncbi:MAG: acetylserotonin O-methyltransferase [Ignavibacteriaceae bacterium]|nr:acetylserotonin O-methyltransferase [Ignavibacteriaceae bacterium]MCW8812363.1 acetylserotonin O-methyltransferase [Chlorobium sp.]
MEEIKSPEDIRELANSFRVSRVLLSAFELKIFSVLDKHMMTSEEVSTKIDADPRATDRLMNALCGMGILKKVKRKFYNSDLSSKYLVEGKPEFMGNLYHTNHLWNTWSYLTDSVKKGSSFKGDQNKKEKTNWVEAFIGAMHYRGVNQGKILSMMIDLSNVRKMIDVGGGSAAFSIEIVKKNPSIKATVLDLPHVVPLTKKYVEEAGLSDNFNFIEGDYLTKDFEDNYDLILLSAIVHINSYEQNKMLINKCADALNKNGMIIISDFVMNDDRTQPVHGALFSINMLVGTASGDTYTEGEMKEWFESADLSKIERKNTSFGSDLMIGIK